MNNRQLDAVRWARGVLFETDSGREAVRAYFYAVERGVPHATTGRFDTPTCDDPECLFPSHQSWLDPLPGPESSSRSGAHSERAGS